MVYPSSNTLKCNSCRVKTTLERHGQVLDIELSGPPKVVFDALNGLFKGVVEPEETLDEFTVNFDGHNYPIH